MDKSWIHKSRDTLAYEEGVLKFLDYAFSNVGNNGKILYPCKQCANGYWKSRNEAYEHLLCEGFLKGYTHWTFHGEVASSSSSSFVPKDIGNPDINDYDDTYNLLEAVCGIPSSECEFSDEEAELMEGPNLEAGKFYKLLSDAKKELYPGCKKFNRLTFIVKLFHIKCTGKWSNNSFTMLLNLLKEVLPEGETLPNTLYEIKKIIKDLGLYYNKIDACPNDCMLYWKEYANESTCKICGSSRWKEPKSHLDKTLDVAIEKAHKIPAKILRHFPLVPRLQRLYMAPETASYMRWHDEGRPKDGKIRHPSDSPAWKTLDHKYPIFGDESRNIRLGLATDGFNPFKTGHTTHSTWPVLLVNYNLPPSLCMKKRFIIMSLLIEGPSGPGNDIDVYLQPLIDELKELWEVGVPTFDALSRQTFQMWAAILWTISDLPGHGNVSGWKTKGRVACPCCKMKTRSRWLVHSRKFCYMGHRRFLPLNHKYRKDSSRFDGTKETEGPPTLLSGSDLWNQIRGIENKFGKSPHPRNKRTKLDHSIDTSSHAGWKKRSIFFELPYWEHLLLRHNLDLMHIEKNVCDSIVGTIMQIEGKSKDSVKARLDLQGMGIRKRFHPQQHQKYRKQLAPTSYIMSSLQKRKFCEVLKAIKLPLGYASNISRCVNMKELKLQCMKSHDCHVLMQQLLPIAIRDSLPKKARSVLIDLCTVFKDLCSKVCEVFEFEQIESRTVMTLCELEKLFPPSFFDVMIHLVLHLVEEARIAGPVHYRWMYPIERYLGSLKTYVKNKSRPEGSIAEGYLAEECLNFCSLFLQVDSKLDQPYMCHSLNENFSRNQNSVFPKVGRSLGKTEVFVLDQITRLQAHRYVLFNSHIVRPFLEDYHNIVRAQWPHAQKMEIDRIHQQSFHIWFKNQAEKLEISDGQQMKS